MTIPYELLNIIFPIIFLGVGFIAGFLLGARINN